jgi:aminoglycoside 3-N-acetyltransferase I
MSIHARRLSPRDREHARGLFALMASVFEEPATPLSDAYLDRLLARPDFWAIAAFDDGGVVGGLTAHTLPMTRSESSELFIYDIAVHPNHQRRGIGRLLIESLRASGAEAGVGDVFVPADDDDDDALEFYRALGGEPAPVTMFTFATREE